MRSHHTRGFTLVELMISLALAGLVIAGAMQLHVAYRSQSSRQQQIAEMQQSLRVSMEILERAIRAGGSGMVYGKMMCATTPLYGVQWWNSNTFPNPPVNSAAITNDNDPDQFKVIAAQPDIGVLVGDTGNSGSATMSSGTVLTTWSAGDLLLTVMPNSGTNPYPTGLPAPAQPTPVSCLLAATAAPTGSAVVHGAPGVGALTCNGTGACSVSGNGGAFAAPAGQGYEVHHYSTETIFRVIPPPNANDTPKLTMRIAPILNTDTATFPWMPIADNIEDMQIALVMQDGRVCGSIDDVTICDPSTAPPSGAMAVRITLVARSNLREQGIPPSPKGGFEDETLTQNPNDGFLRRSMTTEILLRN